jgi:molybdopterin-guanine dinucleotide biosynthesis protein MobB
MINQEFDTPIIGFSAFSGTGKTTLLTQLIPLLKQRGLRLAIIKHAHHDFDVDYPEKDSYKLRHAGARQMLISSAKRFALMTEIGEQQQELSLRELLRQIDHEHTDLILVEGFKREKFLKIELHRPSLGHPLMCNSDKNIIALATDQPISEMPSNLSTLDLNNVPSVADFVVEYFQFDQS